MLSSLQAEAGQGRLSAGCGSHLPAQRRRRAVFSYAAIIGVTDMPCTTIEVTTTESVSATNGSAKVAGTRHG